MSSTFRDGLYILSGYTFMMPPKQTIVFKTGNSSAVRLVGDCGWPASFLDSLGAHPDEIPRPADDKPQRDPFRR